MLHCLKRWTKNILFTQIIYRKPSRRDLNTPYHNFRKWAVSCFQKCFHAKEILKILALSNLTNEHCYDFIIWWSHCSAHWSDVKELKFSRFLSHEGTLDSTKLFIFRNCDKVYSRKQSPRKFVHAKVNPNEVY